LLRALGLRVSLFYRVCRVRPTLLVALHAQMRAAGYISKQGARCF
jgi:hypothetical protein